MSEQSLFFEKATRLLERLEQLQSQAGQASRLEEPYSAWRWTQTAGVSALQPIPEISQLTLNQLLNIDSQKQLLIENTEQFLAGLPANNALLWGPRGTGKSSLIKALLYEYANKGLKLIEVDRDSLGDLPDILEILRCRQEYFILYCDDLSFESSDVSYKSLKVVLDGSVSKPLDNVLIYATSNRRHLVPEYMKDNEDSSMQAGEIHFSEALEEKIALSERFGLWLAFHPFSQNDYLRIVDCWLNELGSHNIRDSETRSAALRWALERGSRSGRSAWQFARHWTGKKALSG